MTNRSPKPSYASPNGTPRRIVNVLPYNIQNFLSHLKEEEGLRRKNQHKMLQQRDLVQAIVDDPEQWEKFHQAIKQQRHCTSMGLTQDLRGLIQDRIDDMEASYGGSIVNRLRLDSSSSDWAISLDSLRDPFMAMGKESDILFE